MEEKDNHPLAHSFVSSFTGGPVHFAAAGRSLPDTTGYRRHGTSLHEDASNPNRSLRCLAPLERWSPAARLERVRSIIEPRSGDQRSSGARQRNERFELDASSWREVPCRL